MTPNERILMVDDEQHLLDGLNRLLGRAFSLTIAAGGRAGIDALRAQGPFAVVVTDMRMPEMDGIEFLRNARTISPHSVYLMLTGNSDQKTAADATNRGRVFRFLNKPCPREVMEEALRDALNEHRVRAAERQVLERTLAGCVQALLQVLHLTHPRLFQRATRVSKLAGWLAHSVGDPDPWQVQIAAALSRIGCVALPDELIENVLSGANLSSAEQAQYRGHAGIGSTLLSAIPRLERVAWIIQNQYVVEPSGDGSGHTDLGVQILGVANALDERLQQRKPWITASREVGESMTCAPAIQEALRRSIPEWIASAQAGKSRTVSIADIRTGMILQEDVRSTRGELLIASGHEITDMLAERLRNFAKAGRTMQPIVVFDPLAPASDLSRAA